MFTEESTNIISKTKYSPGLIQKKEKDGDEIFFGRRRPSLL